MRVGFVGLGGMGRAMATVLLRAGHEVTVWNRTRSRADALRDEGAAVAATPAEAARAGIVISMLADDAAVEAVTRGADGIRAGLPPGGPLPLGAKDNRLFLQAGDRHQVPLPLASLVHDRMVAALARGYGDLDWSAFSRIEAEDAGERPAGGP